MDVAASIISYKTLYNLHCHFVPPKDEEEKVFSKGVVSKALMNVAFQDDGLIQYKAEMMLRIFEEKVMPLIGGHAKAMIVTSSRVAGLRYFNIIKEKLRERGAKYKALYAFSDFTHPETNAEIHEHAVNELKDGELIEERFEGEDYRVMIVANKFQTGFDQPLLAGMFLDKPVVDRNAVQTVSRLNLCHVTARSLVRLRPSVQREPLAAWGCPQSPLSRARSGFRCHPKVGVRVHPRSLPRGVGGRNLAASDRAGDATHTPDWISRFCSRRQWRGNDRSACVNAG